METKKELAEDLAFAFCKEEFLKTLKSREKTSTQTFEVFGISETQWDEWFKEITTNESLLLSTSKTKNVEYILENSNSLMEYACKTLIFYLFRQKVLEMSSNPLMAILGFLK